MGPTTVRLEVVDPSGARGLTRVKGLRFADQWTKLSGRSLASAVALRSGHCEQPVGHELDQSRNTGLQRIHGGRDEQEQCRL